MNKNKKAHVEYIKKWKSKGLPTTFYSCPHCKSVLEATCPSQKGEVWDSMKACYDCNKLSFVIIPWTKKVKIVQAPEGL